MQVHVDDVEAHVTGPDLAEDRVQIGAIVVQQPAGLVDQARNLGDATLEHADRGWVGQHDACGLWTQCLFQRLDVDVAIIQCWNLAHRVATHHCGGRVGAVRRIGHDDLASRRVAARIVVGADHRHAGELTLRPGGRDQRHRLHAGDVLEHLLQLVHARHEALAVCRRGMRMARQHAWQHRQGIARARIVFHGARTQRIELGVDREVLLRQPRVVTHRLHLRDLGQLRRPAAQQCRGDTLQRRTVLRRLGEGAPSGSG